MFVLFNSVVKAPSEEKIALHEKKHEGDGGDENHESRKWTSILASSRKPPMFIKQIEKSCDP